MATPNTIFAVIGVSNPTTMRAKIADLAPWVSTELGEGQWLLVAPAGTTAKEVSDRLGFSTADSADRAVILRTDGYFGRHLQSTWEWLAAKQGAELGTVTTAQR